MYVGGGRLSLFDEFMNDFVDARTAADPLDGGFWYPVRYRMNFGPRCGLFSYPFRHMDPLAEDPIFVHRVTESRRQRPTIDAAAAVTDPNGTGKESGDAKQVGAKQQKTDNGSSNGAAQSDKKEVQTTNGDSNNELANEHDMDLFEILMKPFEAVQAFEKKDEKKVAVKETWANPIVKGEDGKERYRLVLDAGEFRPEDIAVRTENGRLILQANHEETIGGDADEGKNGDKGEDSSAKETVPKAAGFKLRQFRREIALPESVNVEQLKCNYKSDGSLVFEAPINPKEGGRSIEIERAE